MKTILSLIAVVAFAAISASCISYSSRPAHETVVREEVITTLPRGYTVRTYHGKRYYYHNNVYYTTHDRGYVIVPAPY
ncbi:MAG: DUF6515 family protein [Chthoniobacterales bacterium]